VIFHRIGLIVTIPALLIVGLVCGIIVGLTTAYDIFVEEWFRKDL